MIQAAMTKDFSWDARAQEYVELYRRSRRTVPVE